MVSDFELFSAVHAMAKEGKLSARGPAALTAARLEVKQRVKVDIADERMNKVLDKYLRCPGSADDKSVKG